MEERVSTKRSSVSFPKEGRRTKHNGSIHTASYAIRAFIVLQNKTNSKTDVLQNDFSNEKESLCQQKGEIDNY